MKKKDLQQHIMDVDNNHGRILTEQEKRIELLEFKVANLVRVIENNSKQWLNTPVDAKTDCRPTSPYLGASPELRNYREAIFKENQLISDVVTKATAPKFEVSFIITEPKE